jgi:hypothetical protein
MLAHLFMAAWICVLLQGALRKWAFPGLTVLYLIQDVPLLLAYIYALKKGLVWGGKLAWLCIGISLVLCLQTMLQIIFGNLQLRTAVIGLHHYIFYLPILFLAPVCYNFKHRLRFIRWNLLVIIPMAIIAALQSRAPKGAWINRTSAGDDSAFGLAGDTVRATGTFNFAQTYAIWCGIAVGLALGEWLLPPNRRSFQSKALLLIFTLCAVMATMVSGSRSAVFLAVLGFIGAFSAVVVTRNVKHIVRFGFVLVLTPILTLVAYIAAPASFSAVIDRFSGDVYQEELVVRIEHMFVGFVTVPPFSPLGVGVGFGIPAANPAGSSLGIKLSEHESIRTVLEMGTFTGSALVLLRYIGGIWLIAVGFRCLTLPRGHSLPHAVPLAFAAAPTLMIGELERSAPAIATQNFFIIALILSAVLFRREPLDSGPVQLSETR